MVSDFFYLITSPEVRWLSTDKLETEPEHSRGITYHIGWSSDGRVWEDFLLFHKDDNHTMLMIRPKLVTFNGEEQKIFITLERWH